MIYRVFLSIFLISLGGISSCSTVLPSKSTQTNSGIVGTGTENTSNTGGIDKNSEKEGSRVQKSTESGELVDDAHTYGLLLETGSSTNFFINHVAGKKDSVNFTNNGGKILKVNISFLGKSGNLRLSEIVLPDGTKDGPFGIDTDYKLTKTGNYTLHFDENQMNGEQWSGTAQIDISISK